ncbi:polysaccharide deacetylase family protein [Lutibacter sp.]|uniref:polysaccharide deacetylase family protein n=1 Tax=Lutibacter sp. TaxID=1925666 RepID=UPI0025BB1724|nr:polysaccharide deacetylase family protein [Lutibacter sp.]MCF6181942.1 polysaccharide deacetylase family protein [Lutibacter sp.]
MKKYIVKTPKVVKHIFSNWKWKFSTLEKVIYLTFDDGPTPKITTWVLNELKKHKAKATFFCVGKNVVNHPKIVSTVINEGHTIGNHTHNHAKGLNMTTDKYLLEVASGEKAILKTTKIKPNLFRPPYGKFKISQAKQIRKKGYKIIMWDVLSADFDTSITKEQCLHNVIKNTENGSVVTFHDSKKAIENLKYVLPKILKYYSEKGFAFKAIY